MMTGRAVASARDAARQRDLPLDRLLDEEGRGAELLQRGSASMARHSADGDLGVVILLVAVERDAQALPAGRARRRCGSRRSMSAWLSPPTLSLK